MPLTSSDKNKSMTESESTKQQTNNDDVFVTTPTMTRSMWLYWILPLLIFVVATRYGLVAPETKTVAAKSGGKHHPSKKTSVKLDFNKQKQEQKNKKARNNNNKKHTTSSVDEKIKKYSRGYQQVWKIVNERRQKYNVPQLKPLKKKKKIEKRKQANDAAAEQRPPRQQQTSTTPKQHVRSDPNRAATMEFIDKQRSVVKQDPTHLDNIIGLADAMRHADLTYHDGGSLQMEALDLYQQAIDLVLEQKQQQEEVSSETSSSGSIKDELFVPMHEKSLDGKLCALYTNRGKLLFMANMFEKAVESYKFALQLEPLYLDALGAMGTSLLILGQYEEAGQAFYTLLQNDSDRIFVDVFTGLSKVLTVKESAVPGGWDTMVTPIQELIPSFIRDFENIQTTTATHQQQQKVALADSLNRLHHAMFIYHDVKTKNTSEAYKYLSTGYKYKMAVLPEWNASFESQKVLQTQQIFRAGFWPPHVGSDTQTPIFIIGFVRSGSTLLERVLDAHSLIVGTGEDSVFNGRLDEIRNDIVQASMTGDETAIQTTVQRHADGVVKDMRKRWQTLESQVHRESNHDDDKNEKQQQKPLRFADKMLTNYMNVGFLHMLFPKALILHVARNPMDTVFSAYKHEFPSGTLDYTSDYSSLAQLYKSYRTIMQHWDDVLPGRIVHVRYEDMVHDMPNMARAIIKSTGLQWEDAVLDFYKKRHAVNTLSTTQVRKQVYKDSLSAWKRYEEPLQPLVEMLGEYATWDLKTTLPSYSPPPLEEEEKEEL